MPQHSRGEQVTIDVVIPVLNGVATIAETVTSALGQTYQGVRVYVVDDGSTDGTLEVLHGLRDHRLVVETRDHVGPAAARNAGARLGSGTYVSFLDCDDRLHPVWAEVMLRTADGAGIVSCAGRFIRPGREDRIRTPGPLGPEYHRCPALFLPGLFVVERSLFETVDGYDERLRFAENTDLGFRLTDVAAARGSPMRSTQSVLIDVHQRADGRSQSFDHSRVRDAAELILANHNQRLAMVPRHLGSWHAIAGVNALAVGDRPEARTHMRRAVALAPRSVRYWLRFLQTLLPSPGNRSG